MAHYSKRIQVGTRVTFNEIYRIYKQPYQYTVKEAIVIHTQKDGILVRACNFHLATTGSVKDSKKPQKIDIFLSHAKFNDCMNHPVCPKKEVLLDARINKCGAAGIKMWDKELKETEMKLPVSRRERILDLKKAICEGDSIRFDENDYRVLSVQKGDSGETMLTITRVAENGSRICCVIQPDDNRIMGVSYRCNAVGLSRDKEPTVSYNEHAAVDFLRMA